MVNEQRASVRPKQNTPGSEIYKSARGELTMTLVGSNLIVCRIAGHFDFALSQRALAIAERFPTRRELFHDWDSMSSYDTQSRLALTAWLFRNRATATVHVLQRSGLVAMGVTVAQLAIGQRALRSYTSREAFEAAIRDTVAF